MYFINPHGSLCFGESVGSIKNIPSFRFPHLILFIQLQGMETSRIQFVLQSWSSAILAQDWEFAFTEREGGEGRGGRVVDICTSTSGQSCPTLCH